MNLSDVINATQSGIANENHNANDINVSIPDRGERPTSVAPQPAWDAGEYQMSLAEVQRRWDAANTPEAREALRQDLIARAKNRANLFTRSDGKIAVMVSGEPSWHELGYTMRADFSAQQIKDICINWTYEIEQARDIRGNPIPKLNYVEIVDGDDRRVLSGVGVGNVFGIIQPSEFVDWSARLVGSINGARFCAAGAVDGGKRIWCQAKLPEVIEPIRGDVTEHYLLTTDVFDSSGKQKAITTAERGVCDNTLRMATSNGTSQFANRHTTNMAQRMDEYAESLESMRQQWRNLSEASDEMVRRTVGVREFAKPILDDCLGVTEALTSQAKALELAVNESEQDGYRRLLEKRAKKADTALDAILDIAESETNTARGSVWGAFQSVTQYANHNLKYKGGSKDKSGFESLLMGGRADVINQQALASALELAS